MEWIRRHTERAVTRPCVRACVVVLHALMRDGVLACECARVLKCHIRFGEDVWDLFGANIATPSACPCPSPCQLAIGITPNQMNGVRPRRA